MARKGTLDRRQITEAALVLLHDVGLAELSTRRLAARLGVSPPTLYWHVKDKAQLLDLLAEAICADAFTIDGTRPWHEQLLQNLCQFRALLLRHRDAATLLRERPPLGPNRLAHLETTTRILLGAGFSPEDCSGINCLLTAHVLASAEDHGHPEDGARTFELATEVILDGLVVRRTEHVLRRYAPHQPL